MSSELELTAAGRRRLVAIFRAEKEQALREECLASIAERELRASRMAAAIMANRERQAKRREMGWK